MNLLVDLYEATGSEILIPNYKNPAEANSKARELSKGFPKEVYVYEFKDGSYAVSSAKGQNGKIISRYTDGKLSQSKKEISFDFRGTDRDARGFVSTNWSKGDTGSSYYGPYGK